MKKSEFKKLKASFRDMQLTPRRGVLDAEKKLLVLQFIGSGLSRREAAQFVECAHTTIGRTAARDPEFAAALRQAESISRLQTVTAVRQAARDPKYWRAAAWMLERRSPEDYARRDPDSFTSDQVMSLLARLYGETVPLLPAEKVEQFQGVFDEALDEIEAKSGPAEQEDNDAEEDAQQGAHLAAQNGIAGGNGHAPGTNGESRGQEAAPSNGHGAGLPTDMYGERRTVPSTQYTVEATSNNGTLRSEQVEREEPLAEREEHAGPPTGRFARRQPRLDKVVRRFDSAQLHQPHPQGVGASCENDDRKVMPVHELQQESTECTTTDKLEGRCNKEVLT